VHWRPHKIFLQFHDLWTLLSKIRETTNLHINGFYKKMLKGDRATPSLILLSMVQS